MSKVILILLLLCSVAAAGESKYITTELPYAMVEKLTTVTEGCTFVPEYAICLFPGMQLIDVEAVDWGTPVYRLILTYEGRLYHIWSGRVPLFR
jgi:hypothetical protein